MQGNTDNVIFEDGTVLHRKQCEEIFGDWINSIADFSTSLYRMSLDISALACMEALTLVTCKYYEHILLEFSLIIHLFFFTSFIHSPA